MAAEAPVRAAAPSARRPAAVVSASRLLLAQRPFLAHSGSRSRFAAWRAAVADPTTGLRPRLRRPRLSVVAMAASVGKSENDTVADSEDSKELGGDLSNQPQTGVRGYDVQNENVGNKAAADHQWMRDKVIWTISKATHVTQESLEKRTDDRKEEEATEFIKKRARTEGHEEETTQKLQKLSGMKTLFQEGMMINDDNPGQACDEDHQ